MIWLLLKQMLLDLFPGRGFLSDGLYISFCYWLFYCFRKKGSLQNLFICNFRLLISSCCLYFINLFFCDNKVRIFYIITLQKLLHNKYQKITEGNSY